MVVKVCSVTLTLPHVVADIRAWILGTGMLQIVKTGCHLKIVIQKLPMNTGEIRWLPCIVGAMVSFRVAYITVAYQSQVLVEVERQYISEYTRLEVFLCG